MSQTDKAAAAADTGPPAQVDIDNVINDIYFDREEFTKQRNKSSVALTQHLEKNGILPAIAIEQL